MSKELTIYLGDMVHNFVRGKDIWTVPLNICCIASYVNSFYADRVNFRLFKFPDMLLKAVEESPPDVIGLSNYLWNSELSAEIVRLAKKKDENIVTVMGGPNVTQTEDEMSRFMGGCSLDYYVSYYGEHSFKCLVEAMLKHGCDRGAMQDDPVVEGVWYRDERTGMAVEKAVRHTIDDLDSIPSPFTGGLVDEFFEQDLFPMIETHRGCPFLCTYCDWGSAGLKRISEYSVGRVKEDVEYCRVHSRDERLMIDDANFGILGKRDLEIAEYLQELKEETGYPGKLIMTWSQAKSGTILKIADALKDMMMVTTSFQSMNEDVLKNIKRKNVSHKHFAKIIDFCRARGIDTYGELMLCLPGETLGSHFEAIRYLFDMGVDFLNINPLMLLEGAPLCREEERAKYGMKTKWRLLENCYGCYGGSAVIEYQEMVVETDTISEEDYLLCRPVSWLIQMSWNLRRHEVLMKYLQSLGVNPLDVVLRAIKSYRKADAKVAAVFEQFFEDAREELFESKEDLIDYYSQPEQLENLRQGGFRKLNTHYTSRVSLECSEEFVEYYGDIARALVRERGLSLDEHEGGIDDCCRFMYNRYIGWDDLAGLRRGECADKELSFQYDVLEWLDSEGESLEEFYCPAGFVYSFSVGQEQRRVLLEHLERFGGLSSEYELRKLQEPYHGIHKKYLLYNIEKRRVGTELAVTG